MRNVYITFKDPSNFKIREAKEFTIPRSDEVDFAIVNGVGQHLCLDNPKLKRCLLRGVFIEDSWGTVDRWFHDLGSGFKSQRGEV